MLILGVCLGAQAITCYYGGHVIQGEKVMHGKVDILTVIQQTKLYSIILN
jgi:anthranilate synthase component 2